MATTMRLDSLDDVRLDVYARLTDHQLRNALEVGEGVLVAESRNAIEPALDAGVEPMSFLVDETHLCGCQDLFARADAVAGADVSVFVLSQAELERLCGYRVTRGLLCAMRRPATRAVGEVTAGALHVAVLEDLVDVSNLGALFRSAAALGADAVVLSPRCADPYCRRAVRTSAGTVFQVPWARAREGEWPDATLGALRARGLECCAMALAEGATPLDELEGGQPRALVFGSEGPGLTPAAIAACDRSVIIPMAHGVDSLNVAASSAVAFWHLFR